MKKKIILIVILIIILSGPAFLSYASLLEVPLFSNIFYKREIANLGIEIDPQEAKILVQKLEPEWLGWEEVVRKIEIKDVELASFINLSCEEGWREPPRPIGKIQPIGFPETPEEFFEACPFEYFQIRFEKDRFIVSFYDLDLKEIIENYYPNFKLPLLFKRADITIFGKLTRKDERSINLEVEKIYLGNFPLFGKIKKIINQEMIEETERKINERLKMIEELRIDSIQILEREIILEGILPPIAISLAWEISHQPKPCVKDEDCGEIACQQGRNKCVEIRPVCRNFKCSETLKTGSSEVREFPGFICQHDGRCRDTCGNGICDSGYESLHCPQDCR